MLQSKTRKHSLSGHHRQPGGGVLGNGRAWVLHPLSGEGAVNGHRPEARLAEAARLAAAIDLEVVRAAIIPLRRVRPSTLFGKGLVTRFARELAAERIDLVIVDRALTPMQQRDLETAWSCKVIDRTGLILEIFGARARSREGRLQVEVAALTYQRSRLVRAWTHLERQRGGYGFLGGPGESQIESDRRQIDQRLARLRERLGTVRRTRALQRGARRRVPYPVVALVGYTNAGKSTLFNRLSGAGVRASDELFATLDPTMRGVVLPSGRTMILSDTVGFISGIPADLIAAFRATLEEVVAADIVVHVRDLSDPEHPAQKRDVEATLAQLGVNGDHETPVVEVLNKIDKLSAPAGAAATAAARRKASQVALSARTGGGCERLLALLDAELGARRQVLDLRLAAQDGAALAWLYRHGEVLNRDDDPEGVRLRVGLDPAEAARFRHRFAVCRGAPTSSDTSATRPDGRLDRPHRRAYIVATG